MGKIIKINMYSEKNRMSEEYTDIEAVENNIRSYNKWLEKNNKLDNIEHYSTFLNR